MIIMAGSWSHLIRTGLGKKAGSVAVREWAWFKRSYYVKPKTKRRGTGQAWLVLGGVTLAIGGASLYMLGRPEETIAGLEAEPDKYAGDNILKAYCLRAWDTVTGFKRKYTEPSSDLLLPDHLPHPYQRRYTLLLELKDVLIHSHYDRKMGWKHQKRPGLDAFLNNLFDHFEIVVFTTENAVSTHPLIEKMDPNHFIMYRLYRDSTKYIDGHHVKDLTNLNRSLNRVIILDTDPSSVRLQSANSILVDKWTGDIYDTFLTDLSSFLLTIAVSNTDDVRPILDYYKSFGEKDIIDTFKANRAKLREEEEKRQSSYSTSSSSGSRSGATGAPFNVFSLSRRRSPAPFDMSTDTPPNSNEGGSTSESTGGDSGGSWFGNWFGWK